MITRSFCHPIWLVIMLVIQEIGLPYHSCDYRLNWTPLSPITIIILC